MSSATEADDRGLPPETEDEARWTANEDYAMENHRDDIYPN